MLSSQRRPTDQHSELARQVEIVQTALQPGGALFARWRRLAVLVKFRNDERVEPSQRLDEVPIVESVSSRPLDSKQIHF